MSFILVVEPDAKSATAIHKALATDGLEVRSVSDPDAALQMAAARAPKLVIVNGDVQQAERLLSSFARREGGPGAVALISKTGREAGASMADELLLKPFTDAALREAVERCWEAERNSASSGRQGGRMQLSSEEIFGDVLAELEDDGAVTPRADADKTADVPDANRATPASATVQRSPGIASRSVGGDVDSMLADTLAGLDLAPTAAAKKAASPATTAASPASSRRRKASVIAEEKPAAAKKERAVAKEERAATIEPTKPVAETPAPVPVTESAVAAVPAMVAQEELAADVLEPVSDQEMDDTDGRSRMVLIGAIAATALIGLLLVVLLNFRGDGEPETQAAGTAVVSEVAAPPSDDPAAVASVGEEQSEVSAAAETEADAVQAPTPRTSPPSTVRQKTVEPRAADTSPSPPAAAVATEVAETVADPPAPVESTEDTSLPAEIAELEVDAAADVEGQGTADPAELAIETEADTEMAELSLPEGEPSTEVSELAAAADSMSPAEPEETVVSRQMESLTPESTVAGVEEAPVAAVPSPPAAASATPAPQVQPGELVTAGPGVVAPKLVSFAKPRYPEMARRLHRQGTVIVSVLVGDSGEVIEAKIVQEVMATFDTAVLRAAKRARFTPATKNGIPVKMWRNIEVRLQADS